MKTIWKRKWKKMIIIFSYVLNQKTKRKKKKWQDNTRKYIFLTILCQEHTSSGARRCILGGCGDMLLVWWRFMSQNAIFCLFLVAIWKEKVDFSFGTKCCWMVETRQECFQGDTYM